MLFRSFRSFCGGFFDSFFNGGYCRLFIKSCLFLERVLDLHFVECSDGTNGCADTCGYCNHAERCNGEFYLNLIFGEGGPCILGLLGDFLLVDYGFFHGDIFLSWVYNICYIGSTPREA